MSRTLLSFKLDAMAEAESLIEDCVTIKQAQTLIIIFRLLRFFSKKQLNEILETLIDKFNYPSTLFGGFKADFLTIDDARGFNVLMKGGETDETNSARSESENDN